jgi:hypothetical protein
LHLGSDGVDLGAIEQYVFAFFVEAKEDRVTIKYHTGRLTKGFLCSAVLIFFDQRIYGVQRRV